MAKIIKKTLGWEQTVITKKIFIYEFWNEK